MTLTQFLIIMGCVTGGLILAAIILHRSMIKETEEINQWIRRTYDKD